jgi:phage baseplate assembly protein W
MNAREFLGTGWRFPLALEPTGGFAYVAGEEKIRQALRIVLGTARGERQMRPRFGSGMHELVFGPTDEATRGSIAHAVREALTEWEPRIDVLDVAVEWSRDDENLLVVDIAYRVRSNNTLHNLVYPFYIREGVRA